MARRSIDWEKVEREYRLGKMTFAEMSEAFGVNASSITRRAKKEGWTRDLSELVKQQTKAHVSAQVVAHAQETHKARISADAQAVEVEAISNALMIAEHEKTGTKGRELFAKIIEQIAEQVAETPTVARLVEMVEAGDAESVPALRKVLSLPSYVDSAKKAVDGAAKAIEIERKARNLDEAPPPELKPVERIELVALLPRAE